MGSPWLDAVRALDRRRGHAFITGGILKSLPPLGSQDGKGLDAVARVRYFGGGVAVWYVTELDPETGEAFGWADLFGDSGELGYMDLGDLGTTIGRYLPMERDIHWSPRPLSECEEVRTLRRGA